MSITSPASSACVKAWPLRSTPPRRCLAALAANPIYAVLEPSHVARVAMTLERSLSIAGGLTSRGLSGARQGRALPLKARRPVLAAGRATRSGFGSAIPPAGAPFISFPDARPSTKHWRLACARHPLVLFDGTLYTDAEMIAQGPVRQDRPSVWAIWRWPGRRDRSRPSPPCR